MDGEEGREQIRREEYIGVNRPPLRGTVPLFEVLSPWKFRMSPFRGKP